MTASALAEPDTPPMRVLRMTLTWARLPAMCPTRTLDSFTSREVMPVAFMRFPAKMKRGMARSVKLWVWATMRCTEMEMGMLGVASMKTKPASPMAKATGMPRKRSARKTPTRRSIPSSPFLRHVPSAAPEG